VDGDHHLELVEGWYDAHLKKVVPVRQLPPLARSLPFLRERYTSIRAFSSEGIDELLDQRSADFQRLQASHLESMVFLNRGDRFEARPLPIEAQFAPASGVSAADLNGDGHIDLVLSMGFFSPQLETSRYDSAGAVVLAGNGNGHFRALGSEESGIQVVGEGRGVAVGDWDRDGRVDVLIGQNHAATRLFRGRMAAPSLQVRLHGGEQNPFAVGAVIRGVIGGKAGPAVEIHAGSGHGSQDSLMPLIPGGAAVNELQVSWPGGARTVHQPAAGARVVRLHADGRTESP
jgi:hypothetical protein